MPAMEFQNSVLPPEAQALRDDIRVFLDQSLEKYPAIKRADSWMGFDANFSRAMGARGLIGVALPQEYGGGGLGAMARFIVSEEMLAAGAPVSAHWIADRQSAPLLIRYGTPEQRARYIPGICRGEIYFCIGMSEPNSGSDLASIRTKAHRVGGGWILNGSKIWTTNAHRSHFMIALVRTTESGESRHAGMSQMIVDLSLPGVTIRPIRDLTGEEHFNEVFFDDVELSNDALIGEEGNGWGQVIAELAFERSGPERFLSTMTLMHLLIDRIGRRPDRFQSVKIGRLTARLHALRAMSLSIAADLDAGRDPALAATCMKDMGTALEQELPEIAMQLDDAEPRSQGGDDYEAVLSKLMLMAPSFSLRGGTREILRGIIARGMGVR